MIESTSSTERSSEQYPGTASDYRAAPRLDRRVLGAVEVIDDPDDAGSQCSKDRCVEEGDARLSVVRRGDQEHRDDACCGDDNLPEPPQGGSTNRSDDRSRAYEQQCSMNIPRRGGHGSCHEQSGVEGLLEVVW